MHFHSKWLTLEKYFLMTSKLILFRMDFFGAAHGCMGGQKEPLPSLKSATYILQ